MPINHDLIVVITVCDRGLIVRFGAINGWI